MNNQKNVSEYYEDLDNLFNSITNFLNKFNKSQILHDYFFQRFKSSVYANLIENFFRNLTQENIKELGLSKEQTSMIKKEYKTTRKNVKSVLNISSNVKIIDEKYYLDFKSDLKKTFPDFLTLITKLEKLIHYDKMSVYFSKKKKEIEKIGNVQTKLENIILTKSMEAYVIKHRRLPIGSRFENSLKTIMEKSLEQMSEKTMKILKLDTSRMLKEHRKIQKGFETRLYKRWKKPLDLFESFVVICLESGEDKKNKLSKGKTITNPKQVALIKIHARSVQIAYEILTLIRSGFADGAFARWRSIHELGIITFFLRENNDDVSTRYLEHDFMKKFKEAKNYQMYYKKLGHPPITKKEFNRNKKVHDKLLQKYGSEFEYRNGFEWIPKSILPNRNFRSLQEHVKLDKFHPFYSWSSDSVHGGSKGLHRLGLIDDSQNKVLAAGPTNYGFTDPIDSTVISLSHVTSNLLLLEPDFEDILMMQVIQKYVKEIGQKALKVQKNLEKEHRVTKFHKIQT